MLYCIVVNQACMFLKSHFQWSCLPVGFGQGMMVCFQPQQHTTTNISCRKTSGSSNCISMNLCLVRFCQYVLRSYAPYQTQYEQHVPLLCKSSIRFFVCLPETHLSLCAVKSLMYILFSPQMYSDTLRG